MNRLSQSQLISRGIAEDAVELVEVEYEPLRVVVDAEKSLQPGAPLLYEEWGDNVIFHDEMKSPGSNQAFEEADYVFRERLVSNQVFAHAYGNASDACKF